MFEAIQRWASQFDSPNAEALKEVFRYGLFFVISWIITATLSQINVLPEFLFIKVWVLSYSIPFRVMVNIALTTLLRYVDKWMYERSKEKGYSKTEVPKGLSPV